MSITLDIPDEIANAAKVEALSSGSSLETLLLQTLAAHFSPDEFDLQAEIAAWDEAADEDMTRFLENEDIE